jgi:hypothetical protein
MKRLSGQTSNFNIDRWESTISTHQLWKVELLAKATGVPVGFYYFNNVQITMIDMQVEIFIAETLEILTLHVLHLRLFINSGFGLKKEVLNPNSKNTTLVVIATIFKIVNVSKN